MCVLLFIACLLSKDRKKIDWKIVVTGLSLQILLAFGMLYIPALQIFFEFLGKIFVKILEFTRQGTAFLAGSLLDTSKVGYIFIFQVLPTLIFFSALISLLYYLNIIQRIVQGVGWCIRKIFRLSGSEGLTVAGNIFFIGAAATAGRHAGHSCRRSTNRNSFLPILHENSSSSISIDGLPCHQCFQYRSNNPRSQSIAITFR